MHNNVSLVDREHSVSLHNLPNALTVIHLPLVLVSVRLMVSKLSGARRWAVLIFMIVASTGQSDGHIACSWSLVVDLGKFVDPIADKALALGAFVTLTVVGLLPWWVTAPVAFRELGITWLCAILLKRGTVVATNKDGKSKTVLQMPAVWVLLILQATVEFRGE